MRNNYKESGLVSILSVIMFMIFASIFVVAFIKIMSDEQRQTTDNDLSASALTAAQGGVEDAKRIIAYCLNGDGAFGTKDSGICKNTFDSAKTANSCSVFKGAARGLFQSMGITFDTTTGEALVGSPEFQQYYTCLTVDATPGDVVKSLVAGRSEIIPLSTVGDAASIRINWSGTGSFSNRNAALGSDFPTTSAWLGTLSTTRPPVVRVQVIPFTPGSIQLDTVEQASDTFFLVPATSSTVASFDRATDTRGAPGTPRAGAIPIRYTSCTTSSSGYDCNMQITNFPNTQEYFLRVSLLYGTETTLKITPFDAANAPISFNNVQYTVDVTGRTNDVYRRVQARVSPAVNAALPEYALESAQVICKDIVVGNPTNTQYCP